ncbi:TetR/AcrR family transcriptional regulator [Frankia tisae]|uniref:TetR/AcrR family transcriptional regulator n=1 Tax=Frankia tisae TaxID=2950104 RepID=UPI0021BFA7C1|nr:TetR/AcrR family transcriptional regulator [Frankia tisae]
MSSPPVRPIPVHRVPQDAALALGRHGTRAQAEIIEAARVLFGTRGYHGVTVEEIGEASGRTGTSVYRYFANKTEIFRVLMADLGADLLRHGRRLGRLGPEHGGFDELRMWLHGFGLLVHRHNATFSLWRAADPGDASLVEPARRFIDRWCEVVGARIEEAGVDLDPPALATALLTTAQRVHELRTRVPWTCSEADLAETFARVFQLAMFPASVTGFGEIRQAPRRTRRTPGLVVAEPLPLPPGLGSEPGSAPPWTLRLRRPLTSRGVGTVQRIITAAADVSARQGLHGTSIKDIAAAADVGYASVYTYWRDHGDIVAALTDQAAVHLTGWLGAASAVGRGPGCLATVRPWVERYLAGYPRHAAVLRSWTIGASEAPELNGVRRSVATLARSTFDRMMDGSPLDDLLDRRCAEAVVCALLVEFPYNTHLFLPGWPGENTADDTVAVILARGLLGDL